MVRLYHLLIGALDWHTDYSAAYRQAQDERRMLFVVFRDEANSRIADIYERDVLSNREMRKEPGVLDNVSDAATKSDEIPIAC